MKHRLQTFLKNKLQWLVLLTALLGVSQGVWGGAGSNWFDLTFSGASTTTVSGYNNGSFSEDLGELKITSSNPLKINAWHCYWYKDSGGNVCGSGKLYWRIGTSGSFTLMDQGGWSWNVDNSNCKYNNISQCNCAYKTSAGTTIYNTATPGQHTLQFYFMASGNTSSTSSCGDLYNSNNSNNYSVTFTIPGITSNPSTSSQTLCVGGSATALSVTAAGSSPSYQWQSATSSGGTYSNISDATSSSYTPPTTTAGTKYYRCKVTISGTTYTSNASGAITVNANPSLTSVSGPTSLTASTNPAGTYTTQSIDGATYTWSTTLTSSSGLNSSTTNSVTAYTGSTTQSGKKVSVYATKNGCNSSTVELSGISVVASCSTPSANDITISAPSSATTLYLGTGSAPSVTQTVTATCSKGNTYLWTATPSEYSYTSAYSPGSGTMTNVAFTSSSSKSTTATFKHEGVYTATFKAGCSNTTDASKNAPTITVKPGHIYFDGPFFSGSGYDLTKQHVAINTSTDQFVYEWTAAYTSGDFVISVGNACNSFATSAYTIGNYAEITTSGVTKASSGNHNFSPNIGTIAVGDRLKLTVAYTGVNASGVPKYSVTLEKVCSNPTVQTVSGTATICSGSSTNVTVASSQSNYTYKLYKGGSATETTKTGTGSALNFSVSAAGTYTVHAYYTSGSDAYCKADMSGSATVTVTPTASIGSVTLTSSSVCIGQGLSATANDVELGGGTGAWSSSNTSVANIAANGNITPVGAGSTNITYTITGGCGGTVSAYATLTVKPNAAAAQYTLSNNTQTYNGAPRSVTVTPATGAGTATVYYSSASYAKSTTGPINAGTYTVTVDAAAGTNYCAASNINVGTLTINKANQSTLTISNTLTTFAYCSGAHTTLTTSGGSGDGAVTYTITSGSGTIDGSTLTATAKNSITVTATKAASQNYNATTSAGKTFNFTQNPPTAYDISAAVTAICSGGDGTITLGGSQTGYNYLLYNNGTPLEEDIKAGTGSAIDFDVTSSGVYTAKGYYGTNRDNCLTDMNETIVMTISTTPKLVRTESSVTNYKPVTITSVNTDIETWTITNEGSTAYAYDKTANAITFKGTSTNSPYTVTATTHGGCSNTTTVTVTADSESCN